MCILQQGITINKLLMKTTILKLSFLHNYNLIVIAYNDIDNLVTLSTTLLPYRQPCYLIDNLVTLSTTLLPYHQPCYLIDNLVTLSTTLLPYRQPCYLIDNLVTLSTTLLPYRQPVYLIPFALLCIFYEVYETNETMTRQNWIIYFHEFVNSTECIKTINLNSNVHKS